jgi:site-specific recombinase XerD
VPSFISITFPASKTDPFRKGITTYVAAVDLPTCAVSALKHLFMVDPRSPDSPLFCNPDGSPLHYSTFVNMLRSALMQAGFDPAHFAGHSFRRGAASSTAEAGFNEYEIQLLGWWHSDSYKLYIDSSRSHVLNLSA